MNISVMQTWTLIRCSLFLPKWQQIVQLLMNFPAFYGTRCSTNMFKGAQLIVSQINPYYRVLRVILNYK
jgi:hypothetical protein